MELHGSLAACVWCGPARGSATAGSRAGKTLSTSHQAVIVTSVTPVVHICDAHYETAEYTLRPSKRCRFQG